jgi:hypothetical protein
VCSRKQRKLARARGSPVWITLRLHRYRYNILRTLLISVFRTLCASPIPVRPIVSSASLPSRSRLQSRVPAAGSCGALACYFVYCTSTTANIWSCKLRSAAWYWVWGSSHRHRDRIGEELPPAICAQEQPASRSHLPLTGLLDCPPRCSLPRRCVWKKQSSATVHLV